MTNIFYNVFTLSLSQHNHPFENQALEAALHIVGQERGVDEVYPFGERATELLCHIVNHFLAQP